MIFQPFDETKGLILDLLPHERTLYRRKSGTVSDRQAIASYVDKAFIVQSLDEMCIRDSSFSWLPISDVFSVDLGFVLDPLSTRMMLVVTGIGLLVHIFSPVSYTHLGHQHHPLDA